MRVLADLAADLALLAFAGLGAVLAILFECAFGLGAILALDLPRRASAPPLVVDTLTLATPASIIPMLAAAACDRSMIRPPVKGPRSLIRTTTDWPFERFSTKTRVPNGSERCAAVSSFGFIRSPLAVRFCGSAYHEAGPSWSALAKSIGISAAVPRSPTVIIFSRILNMRWLLQSSIVWEDFW